jgi:regulator of sirC expression with transglutaminase-like and TPR domain
MSTKSIRKALDHLNNRIDFNADLIEWIMKNAQFNQNNLKDLTDIIDKRTIMIRLDDILKDIDK